MSEPEDILIDAAKVAIGAARRLWGPEEGPMYVGEAHLATHRRRLSFLISAIYQEDLSIRVAQAPAPPTLLVRIFGKPTVLRHKDAMPSSDGYAVFLPRELDVDVISPGCAYRILGLMQAQRVFRRSAQFALPRHSLARALFEIHEAAAAERGLLQSAPGFANDVQALRASMHTHRPALQRLRPIEAAVESLYRTLLTDGPDLRDIPSFEHVEDARDWALTTANELSKTHEKRFRGFLPDLYIGLLRPPDATASPVRPNAQGERADKEQQRAAELERRPNTREKEEDEDEGDDAPWMIPIDEGDESTEDAFGMNRPTDRETGENVEDIAESLSDLDEARVITTPERAEEVFVTDDPPDSRHETEVADGAIGIVYPEWDCRREDYHPIGARVQLRVAKPGDPDWAQDTIREHQVIFDAVQRRFAGLRPRRIQVGRQRDGEDIDIDAWVDAWSNLQAGVSMDEELYKTTRPQRRDVAISLLIDVSASTDAACAEDLRIIDVEKEALLLCCHALETLGDEYAIHAFSGESRSGVNLWSLKAFEEKDTDTVYRRIASLEPDNYTRAGAAIRHATAGLAARKESHRLLLLLSDGKPNDFDEYAGRYGVEDMRQAVLEARAVGIHVFCLTVDQNAPDYMPRIFGAFSYTTLAHARQLPTALLDVLKQLIQQ